MIKIGYKILVDETQIKWCEKSKRSKFVKKGFWDNTYETIYTINITLYDGRFTATFTSEVDRDIAFCHLTASLIKTKKKKENN